MADGEPKLKIKDEVRNSFIFNQTLILEPFRALFIQYVTYAESKISNSGTFDNFVKNIYSEFMRGTPAGPARYRYRFLAIFPYRYRFLAIFPYQYRQNPQKLSGTD